MAGPLQASSGMLKSLARWAWSQGGTRWGGHSRLGHHSHSNFRSRHDSSVIILGSLTGF